MSQGGGRGSRRTAWLALVGVALGLAALGSILATFIIMQNKQDIRPVLIVTYCAFVAAGFWAPQPGRGINWSGAIGVLLGGIGAALALRESQAAFTDDFYAATMAATAVVAVSMGITAQALVSRRHAALAGVVTAVALAAAIGAAFIAMPRLLEHRAYVTVDRQIQPFSVRSLGGEKIGSDTWRGRVVVISYWATWCPPCLAEIPEISALQKRYKTDRRIAIVALNAGYGGDTALKAREFLDRRHFDLASAIDDIKSEGSNHGEAAINLGLKVVPTLFILNRDQRLVATHVGFDSSEHLAATLSEHIDSLVKAPP